MKNMMKFALLLSQKIELLVNFSKFKFLNLLKFNLNLFFPQIFSL